MIPNRTLYVADNLRVMRGLDTASVDLIATDPPFNAKRMFNAPMGSRAANQSYDDRWRWDEVTDEWHDLIAADHPAIRKIIEAAVLIEGGSVDTHTGKIDTGPVLNSVAAYVAWMAPRLVEMHRILKPHGTLYLHCNHEANSYLRLLLDAIFGHNRFRNEIIWCYRGGGVPKRDFARKHQTILRYSKSHKDSSVVTFNVDAVRTSYSADSTERLRYKAKAFRSSGVYDSYEANPLGKHPDDWMEIRPIMPSSKKRTGWRTQKPLELYVRIVAASSNPGDLVLDPFAGCATTCVAAEKLGRRWIAIDIDPEARNATAELLHRNTDLMGAEPATDNPINEPKGPPRRTDIAHISDARLRVTLWNNQGRRCANPYCTATDPRVVDLHLDHRIPRVRGGSDAPENRIGLCGNCNGRKGRKAWGLFLDQERSRLPHPTI